MKHTIRLNESELKRMIAESVRKVLKENDKGYFKRISPYGYEDPTIPSNNEYSNADVNRQASEKDKSDLRRLKRSINIDDIDWDEWLGNSDYDYSENVNDFVNGKLSDDPQNAFDAASKKHILRGLRRDNEPKDYGGKIASTLGRRDIIRLAKLGIPMKIAKDLKGTTIQQIMADLKKRN